jgi:multiple sugar transport system permease protein
MPGSDGSRDDDRRDPDRPDRSIGRHGDAPGSGARQEPTDRDRDPEAAAGPAALRRSNHGPAGGRPDGGVEPGASERSAPGPAGRVARRIDGLTPSTVRRHPRLVDLAVYLLYVVAVGFFVFPVLWVVSVSLRPPGELFSYPFRLLPGTVTLEPYRRVFRSGMWTWLFNSTVVTLAAVTGVVAVSVPAAYAFSRFDFRGRRGLLGVVLLFQMISPIIIVVPLYTVMSSLGLVRTRAGLVLLYVGVQVPFSIWLLKGYFDTIPRELDYAARIDGCNRLQTLRHVLFRPVAPGVAVVAIFNTVLTWSEFVLAYTVLGSEGALHTISIGVYKFQGQYGSDWRAIAAASVVGMVPLVVVFLGLQRYFVRGLVEGALKG